MIGFGLSRRSTGMLFQTPQDALNLYAWYDTTDSGIYTKSGSQVLTMSDKSPNGFTMSTILGVPEESGGLLLNESDVIQAASSADWSFFHTGVQWAAFGVIELLSSSPGNLFYTLNGATPDGVYVTAVSSTTSGFIRVDRGFSANASLQPVSISNKSFVCVWSDGVNYNLRFTDLTGPAEVSVLPPGGVAGAGNIPLTLGYIDRIPDVKWLDLAIVLNNRVQALKFQKYYTKKHFFPDAKAIWLMNDNTDSTLDDNDLVIIGAHPTFSGGRAVWAGTGQANFPFNADPDFTLYIDFEYTAGGDVLWGSQIRNFTIFRTNPLFWGLYTGSFNYVSGVTTNDGERVKVALTKSGGDYALYVNGTLNFTVSGAVDIAGDPLEFGAFNGLSGPYRGYIYEAVYWDTVKDSSYIETLTTL